MTKQANYYMNQFELILDNLDKYGVKIVVQAGDYKTNWLTLNKESIEELEFFLDRLKDTDDSLRSYTPPSVISQLMSAVEYYATLKPGASHDNGAYARIVLNKIK